MNAVTRYKYGGPEVLAIKSMERPTIKEDEILVNVKASTVNRSDCGILRGKPYLIRAFVGILKPSSIVPGTDFAGVVEQVGTAIKDFEIGDRVWGFNDEGLESHAEYMAIQEKKAVAKIPKTCTFDEIVSCAEGAHYAYNAIRYAKLTPESKVLIYGATGAIGTAALQLLKYDGHEVTAVGNTKNLELMRNLGADKVVDYMAEDFTKSKNRYDFVLDAVGKSSFGKCQVLLKEKGYYISSELGPKNENLYLPLTTLFSKKQVKFTIPSNCRRTILMMNEIIENDGFQAVIDRTYDMKDIAEAYNYVETGQKTGNVIIHM